MIRNLTSALAVAACVLLPGFASAAGLRVVTTVPDLADLASVVGGDDVEARALVKGPQDPHFVEPRPSFIRLLHRADLFVSNGLDLEVGWAPVLLDSARNPRIQPGGEGYVDASSVVARLEVPTTATDRSMGDVHPFGNPHYLLDPLNGLRVAALLRDRLSELDPESAPAFAERYDAFAHALMVRLVGPELAGSHGASELARALERGELGSGDAAALGGWLGSVAALRGTEVVQDHRVFPYFASRFGLKPVMELEPLPGIAPTTAHLARVIERVRRDGIQLILTTPYFDPRHARRVAEATGAHVIVLAHQVGALDGTGSYLDMVDHNVQQLNQHNVQQLNQHNVQQLNQHKVQQLNERNLAAPDEPDESGEGKTP